MLLATIVWRGALLRRTLFPFVVRGRVIAHFNFLCALFLHINKHDLMLFVDVSLKRLQLTLENFILFLQRLHKSFHHSVHNTDDFPQTYHDHQCHHLKRLVRVVERELYDER